MQVAGQVKMQHNVTSLGTLYWLRYLHRILCMSMIFSCVCLRILKSERFTVRQRTWFLRFLRLRCDYELRDFQI